MPNNPQMQGNPLAELAARWRPIFAQPGRQYHHVAALRSFRRTRRGARFRVASDDGTTAHLAITFVHPEVIRVQLSLGERPPRTTPMLLPIKPSPVEVELRSDRGGVSLTSASLSLRAEREPWQLTAYDSEGQEVWRQQRQDRAMMSYVAYPMGYSRDEEGNVAFHEAFSLR